MGAARPPPPPEYDDPGENAGEAAEEANLQTFHYHLPPELESTVGPGHLVWVPFGPQKLQGVVLRISDYSPVPTKAILRLARPEPVLTPMQIRLAEWIAAQYVAPLAEAIKLFLPPGLLARADGTSAVHAKRELRITPLVQGDEAHRRLALLARTTHASKILAWLTLRAETAAGVATNVTWKEIKQAVGVSQRGPLAALEAAALVTVDGDVACLAVSTEQARAALRSMEGLDKYLSVLAVLEAAGAGLWRSELYEKAPCDLNLLRDLQRVGVVDLQEQARSTRSTCRQILCRDKRAAADF